MIISPFSFSLSSSSSCFPKSKSLVVICFFFLGNSMLAMDLVNGFRVKRVNKTNDLTENADFVIIKLPRSWVLKLVGRAVILAILIISLSCFGLVFGGVTAISNGAVTEFELDAEFLPMLFRDLENEGILKDGDKAAFVSNGNREEEETAEKYKMELVSGSGSGSERNGLIPDESFDFVFAQGFHAATEFLDRVLKVGGIGVFRLSENPVGEFARPGNYRIVYIRRFDSTVVAMRKTGYAGSDSPAKRRLCGVASEAKKAALKNLEDVLLEPPRAASGKSNRYMKRTRYLPDLMGDSLESYPRRVFIDVGLPEKNEGASDAGWFAKHYPTRNKDFEIYKIETVTEESSGREVTQIGMSDWLRKNVREEEYVVMKAEAEVVEEMVKSKAIRVVDELFMECKHQGIKGKGKRSRRAYWECLALYGMLRDEGVAVHQWWG